MASSPQGALQSAGCSMRLVLLRMGPEAVHRESSGRRLKSGMSLFSGVWDIFSEFLQKREFRSHLGKSRDGMWIEKLAHSSGSLSCTRVLGLALARGCTLLSQLKHSSSLPRKAKCFTGELIPFWQRRVSDQIHHTWWQMLSPWGWNLKGMQTLPHSWVRHLCPLSTGSSRTALCSVQALAACSRGAWTSLFCPGTRPAIPKIRHLHSPVHFSVSCNCLLPHKSLYVLLQLLFSFRALALALAYSCSCLLSPSLWGSYWNVFKELPGGDCL